MATSSSRFNSSGELITDDLIDDILLRLPLKSLLRFKSVSKTWFSLISNPSFVKSRLHRTIASSEADQTLIAHYIDEEDEEEEEVNTTISLIRPDFLEIKADLKFPYSEGEFPFVPDCILVGSSRGIVCVCIALSDISPEHNWLCSEFAKRETNIYLWNPATRQSKLIPPPTLENEIRRVALGFGFDQIGDDFKVVRVVSPPFTAEVYSTNRNVWRKVESDPIDFPYDDGFDVCVHGFLCCVGMYGMMAFDLNTEVLTCIIDFPVRTLNARIVDFNDSVAVIICMQNQVKDNIRLWTLDDEACLRGDGEASWTLKFDIELDMQVDFVHGYFNQDAFLLMSEDDDSYLYNTDKHEATRVPFAFHMHQIHKYTESLVSIPGSKQVIWNSHKDDN